MHGSAKEVSGVDREMDEVAIRKYRLERTKAELARSDIGAILLYDPINLRYEENGFRS